MPPQVLPGGATTAPRATGIRARRHRRSATAIGATCALALAAAVVAAIASKAPDDQALTPDSRTAHGTDLDTLADGDYRLRSVHQERCLTAGKAGKKDPAALVLGDCADALLRLDFGTAEGDALSARLTVPGESRDGCVQVGEAPAVVVAPDCEDGDEFRLHPNGDLYRLESGDTRGCLAPAESGTDMVLVPCDFDASSQHFALEPLVSPGKVLSDESPTEEPPATSQAEPETTKPAPSAPESGTYQVHTAEVGLCLGTGPEPGNEARTVVIVDNCGSAAPDFAVSRSGDDRYRFGAYFAADDYHACIASDAPGDTPDSYLVAPYSCDQAALAEFALVPDGDGHRIVVAATGLCLAPLSGRVEAGRAMSSATCAAGAAEQVYYFDAP